MKMKTKKHKISNRKKSNRFLITTLGLLGMSLGFLITLLGAMAQGLFLFGFSMLAVLLNSIDFEDKEQSK